MLFGSQRPQNLCHLLLLACIGLAAQNPLFRATSNTVRVDVVVTDSKGRPVLGLGPSDFSIEGATLAESE
jgi:hypothetical protein